MAKTEKEAVMANSYTIIDETAWPRSAHCAAFRNCVEPMFCVTFEADVTNFRRRIRDAGISFTMATVYAVCACANSIENFRYRFVDGRVALFDKIDAAFTCLNPETELFKVVSVPFEGGLEDFARKASKAAREQRTYFTGPLANDVFQCSPLPWLSFTHVSHTNQGKKDCSTPLFDWGKFSEHDGRTVMPVSVQAHHSFVDGLHVARFAERLQAFFDEAKEP